MSDTLQDCSAALADAGFSTRHLTIPSDKIGALEALAFEDATVVGFVVAYDTAAQLLTSWRADRDRILMRHRDAFQAAQQKAWNAYLVLVSRGGAELNSLLALGQIEEDLEGIRKIAKAGVTGAVGVREALLPLLHFRGAPALDPIDMREEIALRCTELDRGIVAAFLSSADESDVMQLLEDRF